MVATPETTAPIDRVRTLLLNDAALQDVLAPLREPHGFAARVVEIAAARGIDIAPDAVLDALRRDPLGIDRFAPHPCTFAGPPPRGWLPTAVVVAAGELAVDWCHFAGRSPAEPFYEDALRRARALPLNMLLRLRTPLVELAGDAWVEEPGPDGFVFHMSRCGSTLVSQMIAAVPGNRVISEAAPLDAIVHLAMSRPDIDAEMKRRLLRGMTAALGRGRAGRYVVKLDTWHTLALPWLRAAFPDTRWIFLYRDPVEVLVSHARMSGAQTIPGALDAFYGIANGADLPPIDYAARALARVCDGAIDGYPLGGGIVVGYDQLPAAVFDAILPHFGFEPAPADRAAMAAASGTDAKDRATTFRPDGSAKRAAASPAVNAAAEAHLAARFRQLEALAAEAAA